MNFFIMKSFNYLIIVNSGTNLCKSIFNSSKLSFNFEMLRERSGILHFLNNEEENFEGIWFKLILDN